MRHLPILLLLAACAVEPPTSPETQQAASPSFLHDAMRIVPARFDGTVTEVLPAGGYTYLQLEIEGDRQEWVVTLAREVSPGDVVSVRPFGQLDDFTSERTGRRFERLQFASITPRSL